MPPIIAASILLAFFLFNLPPPGSVDTPLGWDMSEHLIRSTEMAQALESFSVGGVIEQLRFWSVYPPFYYLVSGLFQSVFGTSSLAFLIKMLTWPILVALAWGWGFSSLERKYAVIASIGAAWVLADFAQYQALAHCEMLDVPASAMAIFALASVAKFRSGFSSVQAPLQVKSLVLVSLAVSLTLLTKHNAGLPLFIVCGFFFLEAVICKNKSQAQSFFIITATAFTVWVLFLTWQDHGWHSFLNFAANRSNSSGMSLGHRGLQYGRIFVDQNIGSGIRALFVLGFIALSWRFRRNAFWQACVVYLITYILAISKHTYFLPRNLVVIMPLVATLVGYGLVASYSYGGGGGALRQRSSEWQSRLPL